MKKLFLLFCTLCIAIGLQAAVSKTVNLTTAGTLSSVLTATELTTITDLTLTGTIDARDFKTMRDAMTVLANVDMSTASVAAYTGTGGTNGKTSQTYLANVLPDYSFCTLAGTGKTSLKSITISNSITAIGDYSFRECSSLIAITIPNLVTIIGDGVFSGCRGLTSITIPNSVTTIGANTFSGCRGLASIIIPNSVTAIGDGTFMDCYSLTSITIPNFVTKIGSSAFKNCTGLTSITVDATNVNYSSIDGVLYNKSLTVLIQCPARKKGSFVIPNSVTAIGNNAFSGCNDLTSITIPNSVTSIGNSAFSWCTSLTSIIIPNSVTTIGSNAFSGCRGLTSIIIPDSVTTIGDGTFMDCSSLTNITIPNSVTAIQNSTFISCYSLTSITIPNSVTMIGNDVFYKCNGLTSITIPNSVTAIGEGAFIGCDRLTNITIPNSVTSIGNSAFCYCSGLTSIRVLNPTPVTLPSSNVFRDVPKTIPVYVPAGSKAAYTAAIVWNEFTIIEDPALSIIVSSDKINMPSVQSALSIEVKTNKVATAISDSDWLQVSLSGTNFTSTSSTVQFGSATETNTTVWFIAATNTTSASRIAEVSIIVDGEIKSILVTQAAPYIELSATSVSIKATGTPASIDVTSNVPATVTSDAEWLQVSLSGVDFTSASSTVSFATATSTTTALWFVAASNTSSVERTGTITIVAGDVTKQITVTQAASQIVSNDVWYRMLNDTLSYKEQEISVVETEQYTKASCDQTWLKVSDAESGMAGYFIHVYAQENTGAARSAVITLSLNGKTSKFTVVQESPDAGTVKLSTNTVTLSATGSEKQIITVTSAANWKVPTYESWLHVEQFNGSVVVWATEDNTSLGSRTAVVAVIIGNVGVDTIRVTQEGINPYVSLSATELKTSSEATVGYFVVSSNIFWQAQATESWVYTRKSNDTVYYSIGANATIAIRTAQILVSGFSASAKFVIQQTAGSGLPYVSAPTTATAVAEASTIRIAVSGNTTWAALSTSDWLDISQTTTVGDGEIVIAVQANPTAKQRIAKIMLTGTGAAGQMITLTQAAGNGTAINGIASEAVVVYPNPTAESFAVTTDELVSVDVYRGSSWLFTRLVSGKESVSLADLPAGEYIVVVKSATGSSTHTLIKQ